MRAFVALEISSAGVIDSLVAFQRELAATGADLKLVERDNLHFTVKFLGEITEAQARDADARLKRLSLPGATAMVKGAGAFPGPGRPSVVWAGVAREQEAPVKAVAEWAIAALEGIGVTDRRPFTAHVTLARVRSPRGGGVLSALLRASGDRSFGTVRFSELKLKSSVLGRQGPTYSDLGAYPLQ